MRHRPEGSPRPPGAGGARALTPKSGWPQKTQRTQKEKVARIGSRATLRRRRERGERLADSPKLSVPSARSVFNPAFASFDYLGFKHRGHRGHREVGLRVREVARDLRARVQDARILPALSLRGAKRCGDPARPRPTRARRSRATPTVGRGLRPRRTRGKGCVAFETIPARTECAPYLKGALTLGPGRPRPGDSRCARHFLGAATTERRPPRALYRARLLPFASFAPLVAAPNSVRVNRG